MLRLVSLLAVLLLVPEGTASLKASGPHLADVNILLPPKMTHPVEYRLQGSDGCFKWSWDHHDVLSVLPEYNSSNHCSTSARLRSIAPYSGRKETAIYAADVQTGIVIRCKVFIDNFSRIQIFHSSVKLDLDGLATLSVRAFDSEDNVFSSLVGLQFMWELLPETNGLRNHLVHVPLKDSPLSDCGGLCGDLDIQTNLEDSGVYSDLYLVKGIGIGHEIVSVHLLEQHLKDMADKIVLTVAEAMSLHPPSPVLVLIGAAFQYSLKVIRQNFPQVVTLPSPHHQWSVSNTSVAKVDVKLGLTHALSLGVTSVIVEDTRVNGHNQISSLHVVVPDTLSLYLSPLSSSGDPVEGTKAIPSVSRWYVVSGHQYVIQTKVFSQGPGAQEIHLTELDDVKLDDNNAQYWKIFSVSGDIATKHGWQKSRILKAISEGGGKLTASLTYFTGHDETKEVLKVVQEIMVCHEVKFTSEKMNGLSQSILLPWVPSVYQEVELKATGGCAKSSDDYKWFSSDMATISVSASGVVQAKKPGKATVKVVSIFDVFNYDEVVIEVSTPSSMVMLPNFPVETVIGSHLKAAVTMKASNGDYFYKCDAFNPFVKWKSGSESFVIVNATAGTNILEGLGNVETQSSTYGPPCSWADAYASSSGRTMLHATLSKDYGQLDHSFQGPIVMKASSHIASYPPLMVCQASEGSRFGGYWLNVPQGTDSQLENLKKLYLAPGTHLDVMLLGGPEQWDKEVEFIETVEIQDEQVRMQDGVHVHQLSGNHRSSYRVLCQMLGTFKLVFKRGNLVGEEHPLPAVAEVTLSVVCSIPSAITVIADEPVNQRDVVWTATRADRSMGKIRAAPITVANGRSIRIAAVGISDSGEVFANSSSLSLRWELNSCDGLAHWDDAYVSKKSESTWERFLVLQNETGMCVVRATVVGFSDTTGGRYSTQLLKSSDGILTDAIRLQLVSTLRVDPAFNLLLFNPAAEVNLSIIGGSCFLEANVNDSQVVEIIQSPPGLQCSQLMVSPKGLGTALVTVHDVGLAPPLAAAAVVQVADIDWIKITSREEISLMEGTSQFIELIAGTNDGSTFEPSQYAYMDIHVHLEDESIELAHEDDISSPCGGYINTPRFKIVARRLGITIVYVSARQHSGHEVLSQQIKVEVYAPPRIHPQNIFLVPGASYTLMLKGGPTIGVYVEFASKDDGIATMHKSSGRLSAGSPGNTTLIATVYGNGDTVICQAYGSLEVGIPSSLMLNVQSEQLGVRREMPIYPLFPKGNLFSFYELCNNYRWTIEDEKVLSFQVMDNLIVEKNGGPVAASKEIQASSYKYEKEHGFINVLYGRSAGRTSVTVSFSCDFVSSGGYSKSKSYTASVLLSVVPDIPLALGAPITWILPPHYTTSSLLPLSSESHGLDSHRKGAISYSLLRSCGEKINTVHKDTISIDGDRIITTESNNLACIQAKDRTTGRLEIASCIRVAEVSQIRIATKEIRFHAIDLAVGAEIDLAINYHDILGNPFHEAYNVIPIYAETNFPDIVSINGTNNGLGNINLKAISHGRALVQVSMNNNPQKADYLLVSVGAHLHPQNPVLCVGSDLNFTIEGLNDQFSGRWFSGNESIVSVYKPSGRAAAVGQGTTQVYFESSSMKLQTTVTVVIGDILVDAPKEMLTNAPFPTRGYNFSVKLSDSYNKKVGALGYDKGVPFDCRVDPPYVGYAKPMMDLNTGNLYCLFSPHSPEHLVYSVPKLKGMRPGISVSISASLREAKEVSGSASALFIGGFSILEMSQEPMLLNLTPGTNKTSITVVGNTDVQIHLHGRDMIKVSPINRENFGIGGRVIYEVKALQARRFSDKISITLPDNGQSVEIDVNFEPGEGKAVSSGSNLKFWASLCGSLVLLVLIAGISICLVDRPNRYPEPSMAPATPSTPATITPIRSSPTVVMDQSPRTPQPFLDYVRRTIDETPYYRQEGRRRINPQNTF